jgi:hypothetical protein
MINQSDMHTLSQRPRRARAERTGEGDEHPEREPEEERARDLVCKVQGSEGLLFGREQRHGGARAARLRLRLQAEKVEDIVGVV